MTWYLIMVAIAGLICVIGYVVLKIKTGKGYDDE